MSLFESVERGWKTMHYRICAFRVNSNAESLVNAPLTYVCGYFSFLALMLLSNVLASIQPTDQYS